MPLSPRLGLSVQSGTMTAMKPRFFSTAACVLGLLMTTACAQASAPALEIAPPEVSAAPQAAAPLARPALWKVADEDTTIWLFGTIHILPHKVTWYAGPVSAALDASGELVTEIPIDQTAQSQGLIIAKGARTDGKSLRATLTQEQRARYEATLAGLGLPPSMFDGNDAWFAALMLTMLPLQMGGYNLADGIDTQVAEKARGLNLANTALESADYQIDLFENLPQDTQNTYLDEVVKSLPTSKSDIDAMVAAWKDGNADALARLLNEQEDDPVMRATLLTNRNQAWAAWLKQRLDQPGTVFVAVGAGHLAGSGSVQDQLARLGISSERVQ